ncbi:putative uncharacterized protein DDB_G0286901 [Galleria mellonella]|uniref:Uncharacterized protein n=1 Tax=Galleria mellonella TaxID=7137 RepID=A0A6J3CAD6_GALME|nr:putative uncharacterized protein DDB_G0286901 [Galleria mellonella]
MAPKYFNIFYFTLLAQMVNSQYLNKGNTATNNVGRIALSPNIIASNAYANNVASKNFGSNALTSNNIARNNIVLNAFGNNNLVRNNIDLNTFGIDNLARNNLDLNAFGSNSLARNNIDLNAFGSNNLAKNNINQNGFGSNNLAKSNNLFGSTNLAKNNIDLNIFGINNVARNNIDLNAFGNTNLAKNSIDLNAFGNSNLARTNYAFDNTNLMQNNIDLNLIGNTLASNQFGRQFLAPVTNNVPSNILAGNALTGGLTANAGGLVDGASYKGILSVTSTSPSVPTGLSVYSDNLIIEGPVTVTGTLPFLSTVALEGSVPTNGYGIASCACGDGNVGIANELTGSALDAYVQAYNKLDHNNFGINNVYSGVMY